MRQFKWRPLLVIGVLGFVVVVSIGVFWTLNKFTRQHRPGILDSGSTKSDQILPVSLEETGGWKTHQNERYGFQFAYPSWVKVGGSDEEFVASYAGNSVDIWIKIVPLRPFSILHPQEMDMQSRTRVVNQIRMTEYYKPASEGSPHDERFVYIPLDDQNQVEVYGEVGFGYATETFYGILSTFAFIKN